MGRRRRPHSSTVALLLSPVAGLGRVLLKVPTLAMRDGWGMPCRHCPSIPPTKLRSQLRLYLLVCPMGVVQPLMGVLFLRHGLRGLPPLFLVLPPLLLAARAMAVGWHAHSVRGRGHARLSRRGQPRPLQPTLWRRQTLSKRSFASATSWAP